LALIHDKDQPDFGERPPGPPDLKVLESIADTLRLARQGLGQDLRTVAQVLCIRYAYLEAIEKSEFDSLPGTAYAIGFLRTYAEFLGLDGEQIVERFKREVQGEEPVQELVFPEPVGHNRIPGGAIVLISMVLLAMAYGGWFYLSNEGKNVADLAPRVPERLQAMISGGDDNQGAATPESAAPATGGTLDTNTVDAVAPADTPPESTIPDTPAPAAELETDQEEITAPGAAPEMPAPAAEAVAEIDVSTPGPTPEIVETTKTPAPAAEAETVAAAVPPSPLTDSASAASADPAVSVAAVDPDPTPAVPAAPMSQAAAPSTGSAEPLLDEIVAIPSPPTATEDMALSSVRSPRVYGESDAGGRIVLHAVQDSWVQIRDRQEALLLTRVLRSGDTYYVPDQDGLTLLTGNAGGIAIEVDGVALAPLGPTGEVRRQIALDPARLLDGTALPR
jgi:cytoskeleton protein RodZ